MICNSDGLFEKVRRFCSKSSLKWKERFTIMKNRYRVWVSSVLSIVGEANTANKAVFWKFNKITNEIRMKRGTWFSFGESRDKVYKADRLHYSRKISRTANLLDVFNRAMNTSDPLISSIGIASRISQGKHIKFTSDVLQLLCCEKPEYRIWNWR